MTTNVNLVPHTRNASQNEESPSLNREGQRISVLYQHQRQHQQLSIVDTHFLQELRTRVLVTGADDVPEMAMREFVHCLNAAEQRAAQALAGGGVLEDSSSTTSTSGSVETAIEATLHENSSFFFAVGREAYELSRDPFASGECSDIWRRGGHCHAFRLCVRIFSRIYETRVMPCVAQQLCSFTCLRYGDLLEYRNAITAAYHLQHEDLYTESGKSASNIEMQWVADNIKNDRYFFPTGVHRQGAMSVADITLSYAPRLRAAMSVAATATPEENEVHTFWLTQLLSMPSWEPEDSSPKCRRCGQLFFQFSRLRGARAHHCRACGLRLCDRCITNRAHRSFAKLRKPGSMVVEGDERLVCTVCYEQYLSLERLRYLGALFAMSGLNFAHLALCRSVNSEWRNAAELCISEYRLLLHTCEPDYSSVLTPVGVLLENSLDLILSRTGAKSAGSQHHHNGSDGIAIHSEAALMLLRYVAEKNLWDTDSARVLVRALATAKIGGKPTFSHWHFYCTASCSKVKPVFFFMRAAETMGTAAVIVRHAYVREAIETMTSNYLASLDDLGSGADTTSTSTNARDVATENEDSVSMAEQEVVAIWLLDLLRMDSLCAREAHQYEFLLEALLPSLARCSTRVAILLVMSMKAMSKHVRSADDVVSPWCTVVLDEVGDVRRHRVEGLLEFFGRLDAFCATGNVSSDRGALLEWIREYPKSLRTSTGLITEEFQGVTAGTSGGGYDNGSPYVDLPEPFYNPFRPWITLRSVYLPGVKVVASSTRPVWLAFSPLTSAEHSRARPASTAASSACYCFLYKRENVRRDQLMCISTRLLQLLLRQEVGSGVEIPNYSALPITMTSGLIEKAEGYVLSDLRDDSIPGAYVAVDITTFIRNRPEAHVNFLTSAKLFLLLNYMFSIGDRHQGNVMMSLAGAIFHIDFGFLFSERTLVEKIAGTSMRIDSQFLHAAVFCRRLQSKSAVVKGRSVMAPPTDAEIRAFFAEAAEWFVAVRPHASLFYRLWLHAVHLSVLPFSNEDLATVFNVLFDRTASQQTSAEGFVSTMTHSIYACRLTDVTHSGAQVLRSYSESVSKAVLDGSQQVMKAMWSTFDAWRFGGKWL